MGHEGPSEASDLSRAVRALHRRRVGEINRKKDRLLALCTAEKMEGLVREAIIASFGGTRALPSHAALGICDLNRSQMNSFLDFLDEKIGVKIPRECLVLSSKWEVFNVLADQYDRCIILAGRNDEERKAVCNPIKMEEYAAEWIKSTIGGNDAIGSYFSLYMRQLDREHRHSLLGQLDHALEFTGQKY